MNKRHSRRLKKANSLVSSTALAVVLAAVPLHAQSADAEPALKPSSVAKASVCQAVNHSEKTLTEEQRFDKAKLKKWQGASIEKIAIKVTNIFNESNPRENRWLYRLANRIQVNTREDTIRAQLLFKEGDVLDVDIIEESLRRLYQKEYILDVKLVPTENCEQGVGLELVVRDAWTIEPRISVGHEGGESSGEFGLRDGNFLGSGAELELIYKSNAERSQIDYKYRSQNFLQSRWVAEFYHANLSDGENNRIVLERPFYSNNTQWSYGFSVDELSQTDTIREDNRLLNTYQHQIDHENVFVGHALSSNATRTYRIKMGITDIEREFYAVDDTEYLPETEQQQFTWVELLRQSNVYKTYSNLNYIRRAEDVAMGRRFSIKLGQGTWGEQEGMSRLIARYAKATSIDNHHLFEFSSYIDAMYRRDSESTANSLGGFSASYHHFVDGKNRWQVKARWDKGINLPEYREFTLGEEAGMRGYPLSYQRGDQRYLVNIERRFYSDIHWFNLIRVGAVAFVDVGRAWHSGESVMSDTSKPADHLASVGAGLRFHSSKSGNPAVIHVNVSKPLVVENDIEGYLISFSVGSAF